MFLYRVKLFTLAGFTISVDASWLIFAALIGWTLGAGVFPAIAPFLPAEVYWWMAVVGTLGLFLSIVLHELAHALVARRFGMPIRGITLFIFGGVAELQREPTSPGGEFLMAIAGPLLSLALGTALLAIVILDGALPVPALAVLWYLGYINWLLGLFNLIPAFPLDGGRMLRAALWGWKQDLRWATNIAAGIGAGFGILLILGGVYEFAIGHFVGGVWLFLIGIFLHGAAGAGRQQIMVEETFAGRPVVAFMNPQPITVPPDLPLRRLVEDFFYRHHHKAFPVEEHDNLVGCVTAARLRRIEPALWDTLNVRDIMDRCPPQSLTSPAADALDALLQMQRNGYGWLPVVADGRLVGILSLSDMLHILSLRLEYGEHRRGWLQHQH
ncbi:MAG TPA: site-2 protease family protein [Stellaceae bacterium]|nr:site-2 protease family protein [Stellaceae bacterium]